MKTTHETTMEEYWGDVEDALQSAELIAFDGCHKIYLAMDAEQAEWFRKNYNEKECDTSCNFTGSTQEMLTKIKHWWNDSCQLRFICSVETNHDNPNEGFKSLIPQGAGSDWYDDEDEDDDN
jgi:hypothetical protein